MKPRLIILALAGALAIIAASLGASIIRYAGPVEVRSVETIGSADYYTVGRYPTLSAALAAISDNGPTKRYVIFLPPGTYDLGTTQIDMKPYVDVEGSGEGVTIITCACGSGTGPDTDDSSATINGASNAELRSLTVINTGTNDYATAIRNASASPSLLGVTAEASGAAIQNFGIYNLSGSTPRLAHVTTSATGGTYSYGMLNLSSSPTLNEVSVSSTNGTAISYGIANTTGSPVMTNVSISVSGAPTNFGLHNRDTSNPTLTNVTINVTGSGTINYAIYNLNMSAPRLTNVIASATGGTENYGFHNAGTTTTQYINRSSLIGASASITNDTAYDINIGGSLLDGTITNNDVGVLTCAESYNGSYVALTSACVGGGTLLPPGDSSPLGPSEPPSLPAPGD